MNGEGITDVSGFPETPFEFDDGEGRAIEVREYDGEREALLSMYEEFDPGDRAQGIPPVRGDALERWLDGILEGVNTVAWDGNDAVGHATLVGDEGMDAHELAIFVAQSHQHAGVGSRLIRGVLSLAYDRGVRDVWLSVERWNRAAVRLYNGVGFEKTRREGFEIEMGTRLTV
ncbi:GNAT family N-acetyltransferase [Haladaptatus sp. F3-133]|uniref:GNAT family N-acetyltransferase n=1 Tax=Halorutilus salinus TaxID=2487751 RepID=A0A9Q4C466_9EURY|nr:GNAT family N-acetyltransferase [Halorutilus salinus]MCX2818011.1 GNAT family N-acetyltransferase [Halorutilus salinus]